jgi:SAM-dependent methyltransferase
MSFFDPTGDRRMEKENIPAWEATVGAAKAANRYSFSAFPWRILDFGCHTGGLLHKFMLEFRRQNVRLIGVEPDRESLLKAMERFNGSLSRPGDLFCRNLEDVPKQSVDIFLSHEVLYLVDLDWFFDQLKRVLSPGGAAFVALGCHTENSAWMHWIDALESKYGHRIYEHRPLHIVEKGHDAGFKVGYRELWPGYPGTNWYSPPEDGCSGFRSMEEALGFHKAKLLFEFWKP